MSVGFGFGFFFNKYMNISINFRQYLSEITLKILNCRGKNWTMPSLNPSNDFQDTEAIETEPQL